MDSSGVIGREADEKGELVHVKAMLQYQEEEAAYEWYVTVYPPEYTGEEAWIQSSRKALEEADKREPYSEAIPLPDEIDGQPVTWSGEEQLPLGAIAGLFAAAFACVYLRQGRKVEEEVQKRRNQLLMDYPAMVFKLAMLVGAGMTMRAAFFKMAGEYQERAVRGGTMSTRRWPSHAVKCKAAWRRGRRMKTLQTAAACPSTGSWAPFFLRI